MQHFKALVYRLCEAFLLNADDLGDELLLFLKLGISGKVFTDNGVAHLVEERLFVAEQSAVAGGASDQAAQHVALAFVRGHNAIAYHKGGGADMVGDDAQRDILFVILAVLNARYLADVLHNVLHGVNEEKVVHLLHNAGKTLQAHSGVDVGMIERSVVAVAVALELGEHKVPHLYKAVALAAYMAVGAAAALFGSAVKVYFGAGAAGA